MAERGREKLKEYFRNGSRPTETHFSDLIDSAVNRLDDGFNRSTKDGLKLTQKDPDGAAITLNENDKSSWKFSISKKNLIIAQTITDIDSNESEVERESKGALVINAPQTIVNNEIIIEGIRKGIDVKKMVKGPIKADGNWHTITNLGYGVHAMEIVASITGQPGSGGYAVLLAWASQAFGSKRKIKTVGSHFGFWGHKIKLRWKKDPNAGNLEKYQLQIRTKNKYKEEGLEISCQIMFLHKYEKSNDQKTK